MPSPATPAIILVRPQMGENIGAAARAMMNFGLDDLRIVAPRDGWPNPKAHEMAAKADFIIEQATIHDDLPAALQDCSYSLAASARIRTLTIPCMEVRPAMGEVRGINRKCALVFGPENNGLANADITCCHAVMTIAAHPANTSLNLAQSVGIVAYEWFMADSNRPPLNCAAEERAAQGEIEALYQRLKAALETDGYFTEAHADLQTQQLRQLLTQAAFSSKDIQALHGIVKVLAEQRH